tara:strand:- start:103 stop:339 length:237 start_codon:yes stop_codon:yes gene_type:complete
MVLQVRSVSEKVYEEDGVNYGTPTNMIEQIKELKRQVTELQKKVSLLKDEMDEGYVTCGFSKRWQEYEDSLYDKTKKR